MADYCYNIHDIIKFKVTTKDHRLFASHFNRFHHEFEYFQTDRLDVADFVVEVGPFRPNTKDCYVLEEGQYLIKENYFYTKDSYKTAKWEMEISNIESDTTKVRINSNFSGYFFLGSYIIDFLLRVKLNQKGYPFIHASGLVKDGSAFIFPARSGSGKTITTMHFLDKGYKLLGDNFVIVHGGEALSFPSSMSIFYYNLVPKLRKHLSTRTLFLLKLKYLLFKVTLGYIKIFTPVSINKLFPDKIVNSAPPKAVFLLQVADKFLAEKIAKPFLIKSLLYNNQMDAFPFIDYINEFALIYPDSRLAGHWRELEKNYCKFLENIGNCYRVQLPQHIDNGTLEKIENLINCA